MGRRSWSTLQALVVLCSLLYVSSVSGTLTYEEIPGGAELVPGSDPPTFKIKETLTAVSNPLVKIVSTTGCTTGCPWTISYTAPTISLKINGDVLELDQALDFENINICPTPAGGCSIVVGVTETGSPTAYFVLELENDNDNIPQFTDLPLCKDLKSVKEEDPITGELCKIGGSDADFPDQTNLVFGLTDPNFECRAIAGEDACSLHLKGSLDYEQAMLHQLQVTLQDTAADPTHTVSTTFVIDVEDIADTSPTWNKLTPSLRLQESQAVGPLTAIQIQASDGDKGLKREITFDLSFPAGSEGDALYFELKRVESAPPTTGIWTAEVSLLKPLDTTVLTAERDGSLVFELIVTAREPDDPEQDPPTFVTESIFVTIQDENDKPVEVSRDGSSYSNKLDFEIICSENELEGFTAANFWANDKDTLPTHNRYRAEWTTPTDEALPSWFTDSFVLESTPGSQRGNAETQFSIKVKSKDAIDYDKAGPPAGWNDPAIVLDGYKVKITFYEDDKLDDPDKATVEINFRVRDENDNIPEFSETTYETDVPETVTLGYVLSGLSVKATDGDIDPKYGEGSLRYEWDTTGGGRAPAYLELNPTTGVITVTAERPFDYELVKSERFSIGVRDGVEGTLRNYVTVPLLLNILNVNDEQPSIRSDTYRITIDENQATYPNALAKLAVNDPDYPETESKDLTCTLTILEDEEVLKLVEGWFTVTENCGAIGVPVELRVRDGVIIDREAAFKLPGDESSMPFIERITFEVTVTDNGQDPAQFPSNSDSLTITLVIRDVNDESVEVSSDGSSYESNLVFDINCSENEETGFVAATFWANDIDTPPNNNRYRAEWTTPTDAALPAWFTDSFSLESTPGSQRGSAETQFSIKVKSKDAIDYDKAGPPAGWNDPSIVRDGYTVKVTLIEDDKEDDLNKATVEIKFRVLDENDNIPEFTEESYEVDVPETVTLGYVFSEISVRATDGDVDPKYGPASLRYEWDTTGGRRAPDYLDIHATTGVITVTAERPFDYEQSEEERFVIGVRDGVEGGGQRNYVTVPLVLNITNVFDEQPSIRSDLSRITIQESALTYDVLTILRIVDRDYKESEPMDLTIKLTVLEDDETILKLVQGWFEINEERGESGEFELRVKAGAIIDREAAFNAAGGGDDEAATPFIERLNLEITVTDNGHEDEEFVSSDSLLITLVILDVNDEFPVFEPITDTFWIQETTCGDACSPAEDGATKRKIADIFVTDLDTNNVFFFRTAPGSDPEGVIEFSGTVEDGWSSTTAGKVTVSRRIGGIINRDQIYQDTGYNYFNFSVQVRDADPTHVAKEQLEIKVRVQDSNTVPPRITEPVDMFQIDVTENSNDGACYVSDTGAPPLEVWIRAEDEDECTNVDEFSSNFGCTTFTLDNFLENYKGFHIDRNTGSSESDPKEAKLTTNTTLCTIDREVDPTIDLVVSVYDAFVPDAAQQRGQSHSITLRFRVLDVNDNAPEFKTGTSLPPFPEVEEFDGTEQLVQTIEIEDVDEGPNAQVEATILDVTCSRGENDCGFNNDNLFRLVPTRTEGASSFFALTTQSGFNLSDAYGEYTITIHAIDKGLDVQLPSEEIFRVTIEDINNNSPVMEEPSKLEYYVRDGHPNGVIGTVDDGPLPPFRATDADEPGNPNSEIVYEFTGGSETDPAIEQYIGINPEGADGGALYLKSPWLYNEQGPLEFRVCVRAHDKGTAPRTSANMACITLRMRTSGKAPTFGNEPQPVELSEKENDRTFNVDFPAAFDNDEGDTVYYFIGGFGDEAAQLFQIQDPAVPRLSTSVGLDREKSDLHELLVYATNDLNDVPAAPISDPEDPRISTQYLRINFNVVDVNDESPTFAAPLLVGGISTEFDATYDLALTNDTVYAPDLDLNDRVTYARTSGFSRSHSSLANIPDPPFELRVNGDGVDVVRTFSVQTSFEGFFEFTVSATDSAEVPHTNEATVRVYVVKTSNIVQFIFRNERAIIEQNRATLEQYFSEAYEYRCAISNVDQTKDAGTGEDVQDSTTITAHFIDTEKNVPVENTFIEGWLLENTKKLDELRTKLSALGINLDLEKRLEEPPVDGQQVIIYVLIAGCAVLGAVLLILTASCYFRNRSMDRKVRALSAQAGPQSGSMEKGTGEALPGTNAFALKGSNPIYNEKDGKKIPAFDTESVGSGDSIFIGVELENDFKGYRDETTENPAFDNDLQHDMSDEDDEVNDYYDRIRNPALSPDYTPSSQLGNNNNYEYPVSSPVTQLDLNPMGSVARRNPLLMAMEEEHYSSA